jgi:hypothetical protein
MKQLKLNLVYTRRKDDSHRGVTYVVTMIQLSFKAYDHLRVMISLNIGLEEPCLNYGWDLQSEEVMQSNRSNGSTLSIGRNANRLHCREDVIFSSMWVHSNKSKYSILQVLTIRNNGSLEMVINISPLNLAPKNQNDTKFGKSYKKESVGAMLPSSIDPLQKGICDCLNYTYP